MFMCGLPQLLYDENDPFMVFGRVHSGVCHCNSNGHNCSCLSIRHLFSFILKNDGEFYSP